MIRAPPRREGASEGRDVTASDLVPMLRAPDADRVPSRRRGLWVSFLSAYGLEAVLGTRRSAPGTSDAVTAATGADAIDWMGLDLEHGDLDLGDVITADARR